MKDRERETERERERETERNLSTKLQTKAQRPHSYPCKVITQSVSYPALSVGLYPKHAKALSGSTVHWKWCSME
jgi:hypothetical protein